MNSGALVVVGINHKTSGVEVREKFFLRAVERELLLSHLKSEVRVVEAFVLSTCNRTEIYAHLIDDDHFLLIQSLFNMKDLSFSREWLRHFYIKKGAAAVTHLFDVACGMDSLVIGEKQILGQIKEAAALASKMGMFSRGFNILTNMAIRAGKMAQTNTHISTGGSSVSWAAVNMAQEMLGTLKDKNILIIGAGKMSHLTADQLSKKSVGKVFVMNRTLDKAADLAGRFGGQPVLFWDMKEVLTRVDVCLCSAGAPHYLIEKDHVQQVMPLRGNKPIIFIDISTPRNINPEVSGIPGVQLVSIDDLQRVVTENIEKRRSAMDEVRKIIDKKVVAFYKKMTRCSHVEFII